MGMCDTIHCDLNLLPLEWQDKDKLRKQLLSGHYLAQTKDLECCLYTYYITKINNELCLYSSTYQEEHIIQDGFKDDHNLRLSLDGFEDSSYTGSINFYYNHYFNFECLAKNGKIIAIIHNPQKYED